jgi:hypothetical protein
MSTVFASAANDRYGYWLLNLIGSVQKNTRSLFDKLVVFDLGLSESQRRLLRRVREIEIERVPAFAPHWSQGFAWKPWIWTHLDYDELVWLDAGASVLRPLDPVLRSIRERGYWLISHGYPIRESIPSDYYERFRLPRSRGDEPIAAAGIIGFARASEFYSRVVVPTYDDALHGHSVGFSPNEVETFNWGMMASDEPIVRDCNLFRWDQTLLNVHLYRQFADPVLDSDLCAAWQSDHESPTQLIWGHRRRGDFRFLPYLHFTLPFWPAGKAWATWFRWRWWRHNHQWLFRPSTYRRRVAEALRGGAGPVGRS